MCGDPSPCAESKKDMESARITGWAEEKREEGEEEAGVSVRKKYHLNRTVTSECILIEICRGWNLSNQWDRRNAPIRQL